MAPSGVAINKHGSVEVRRGTFCSQALNTSDLLSNLLVTFRLHCAMFVTKVCVGGGLTRMRLPRLYPCATTSPPSHYLRVGTHNPQPQPTVHLSKYSCSSLSPFLFRAASITFHRGAFRQRGKGERESIAQGKKGVHLRRARCACGTRRAVRHPHERAGGRGNEQTRKPESKPCTPLKHPGLLVMAALNQASQWALTYDRATEAQGARRRGRSDRSKTD